MTTRLRQRFVMHARLQGGALYQYAIMDGERVVGSKSVHVDKRTRPWTERRTYRLAADGQEFANAAEFRGAYERQNETERQQSEWDAAALKEQQA